MKEETYQTEREWKRRKVWDNKEEKRRMIGRKKTDGKIKKIKYWRANKGGDIEKKWGKSINLTEEGKIGKKKSQKSYIKERIQKTGDVPCLMREDEGAKEKKKGGEGWNDKAEDEEDKWRKKKGKLR